VRRAEARGWQRIYLTAEGAGGSAPSASTSAEPRTDAPRLEAFTAAAALSSVTSRIGIAVLLGGLAGPARWHPAILAKMATTVDRLSDGRLRVVIAPTWCSKAVPVDESDVERLDEAIDVLVRLMRQTRTTFAGRYYVLEDAPLAPGPVQRPLPVDVGGEEPWLLELAVRHAAARHGSGSPERLGATRAALGELAGLAGLAERGGRAGAGVPAPDRAVSTTGRSQGPLRVVAHAREQITGGNGPHQMPRPTKDLLATRVELYEAAGCDELVLSDRWIDVGPAH
jgi:alkanesulfonate monooxygenase SsuD/methylene tetrahydromethanopterin reductase-like flavin-dependent oxidoreductase (luciferase family)